MSARIRSTKKYKALIETGLSDAQALGILGQEAAPVSPLQNLLDAGFTQEQAAGILGGQFFTPTAVAEAPTVTVTAQDLADALVAQRGLSHAKGRVYFTTEILEAQARVLKGGKPEIVATSGKGRTPFVLVSRTESGDGSLQNLYDPAKA